MIAVAKEWNPEQEKLKRLLKDNIDEAIQQCIKMHRWLHSSESTTETNTTFQDQLLANLREEGFRIKLSTFTSTIVWNIWHMTRIEDITSNMLIRDEQQVFNDIWYAKTQAMIKDTGNAMTESEMVMFSHRINCSELLHYRHEVGKRTRSILSQLTQDDVKRKFRHDQLERIISEGAVLNVPGAKWLIDFWGKKNVAGILMMPITRHQIVHLNKCFRIKQAYGKIKQNV